MASDAVITALCEWCRQKPVAPKSQRFCSDTCRAKSWHAQHYVKVKPKPPYEGPLCWCGKPAPRFCDGLIPKCGNHAIAHRARKRAWRKVLLVIQKNFTLEEVLDFLASSEELRRGDLRSALSGIWATAPERGKADPRP